MIEIDLDKIRSGAKAAMGAHPWWQRGQHVHDTPTTEPHGWPSGPALLCCMKHEKVPGRDPVAAAAHVANMRPDVTLTLLDELERLRRRECKLCVEYDFDEHDPSCCPYEYGCCGKACPNCSNKGTPRG